MVSTKKSSLDLNQNGNFLQHLERDAVPHSIPFDKRNFEILFLLYLSLLRETYSSEVIIMSFYNARDMAAKFNIPFEDFFQVAKAVEEYWQNNKSPISGMF